MQGIQHKQFFGLRKLHNELAAVGRGKIERVNDQLIKTERYDIQVTPGTVKIYDRETETFVQAWGDPHLHTGDGDRAQFHTENVTIELQDGTKVTIVPTEPNAQGISLVDQVSVMNGTQGVNAKDISGPNGPSIGRVHNQAAKLDDMHADGTVLIAGKEVDDLFFEINGDELKGGDATQRFGEHLLDGVGGTSNIRTFNARDLQSPRGRQKVQDQISEALEKLIKLFEKFTGVRLDRADGPSSGAGQTGAAGQTGGAAQNPGAGQTAPANGSSSSQAASGANDFSDAPGLSRYAGVANQIGALQSKYDGLLAKLNSGEELSQAELTSLTTQLQALQQMITLLNQFLTNMLKTEHEQTMAIARNLRG